MSMVGEVQTLLDDSGVFWTDDHVYDAMNMALLEVYEELRYHITTATITATVNDEFVTLPTNIMIPQRIEANNTEWFITDYTQLEWYDRKWRAAAQGKPKHFVVVDAFTLRMWPRPDQNYTYTIVGVQYPTDEFSASVSDITAPKAVKKAVVFRAGALIANHTRPDLAQQWTDEALIYINNAQIELRNRFGHNIIRVRPGNVVSGAHLGNVTVQRRIGRVPG